MLRKLLLLLLLVGCFIAPAKADGIYVGEILNPDGFVSDAMDDAIPYTDSAYCDVDYRVLDMNEVSDRGERFWLVRFNLVVRNRMPYELKDFRINAHFNERLQYLLVNSIWYNKPLTLKAYSEENYSHCVEYCWEAMVDLVSLGVEGAIELDDFYNVLIELEWKGGSELLSMARDWEDQSEEKAQRETEEEGGIACLNGETIARMLEEGIRQRKDYYGETP